MFKKIIRIIYCIVTGIDEKDSSFYNGFKTGTVLKPYKVGNKIYYKVK